MVSVVPLGELAAGQSAEIHRLEGRPEHVHRLEELGLREGTRIEVFRQGSPCILQMAGGKICLRTDRLVNVFVRPTVGSTP